MITWLLIGAGIGFLLEAGGLGHPRKLTGVFVLKDWTVMQVLPTAIVASMAGVLILTLVGMDTTRFFTPPTQYLAQAVGGFVFGVGFYLGGYCPGTSIVGLASGRLDALPFVGGLVGGYYVWDAFRDSVKGLFHRTDEDTLPVILGVDHRLLAAVFVAAGGSLILWLWWRGRRRAVAA